MREIMLFTVSVHHFCYREAVIQRLIDISFEKKRIKTENNAVIREFISKYEDSFELLDAPAAYRIAKLLLRYYQEAGDTETAILMLERCTVFDIIIKEHLDDYEASSYARTAEEYLDRFDELSERSRRAVMNCWLLGIVDRKNLTFGLQRYPQIRARFERIRQKAGEQFMEAQYIMCKQNILAFALEELLDRFEEYAAPHEEYNAMEQFSSLFTANSYYMDYLYRCSDYDKEYIFEKSMDIATRVLEASRHMVHRYGNYQVNSCVLMFINTASNIVDFNFFKNTMLGATVYANKALYIHTLMAKEISLVILKHILEYDPQYLDGVGGHCWEYCRDHKQEILDLMENCALFHDIGKYFCLDYVSNSSRNLTDDEFAVIKAHPANFSKIYRGANSPEVVCIHDCALLHHVWYNGQGGYPEEKHTVNQPFINIISIADSIDAATDNIGRPYGTGKTLEQLMTEFESQRDTRYCGYICDLLHADEVKRAIEDMINTKRKEINYRVYLGLEEGQ